MNLARTIVTLCALAAVAWSTNHVKGAEQEQQPEKQDAATIKELQQERIAALSEIAECILLRYQAGQAAFSSMALAQADLITARLDATDKPDERISLLEEHVRLAKKVEEYAKQKVDDGTATRVDFLRAKANVLEIRIKLLRERASAR